MKRLLAAFILLAQAAFAAPPVAVSGDWQCRTVSYQQYGNNYLIFIDNTRWQHKEDGTLHGEGTLEVRIHGKENPPARLYFIYVSDGNWQRSDENVLIETIKPHLATAAKTAPLLRQAAENIARDVNGKPQQTVASNIIFLNAYRLILEDRESHDLTRCRR